VDSNVLLDVLTGDPTWGEWSTSALAASADGGLLAINPLIYAEISTRFTRIEDLDEAVPPADFERLPLPWSAGFLAAKAFTTYRRRGGGSASSLPDFYIGAQAAVAGLALLTRDAARYRAYFPHVRLVAP
jgi:predicted nucleic acid-binding protein